MRLFEYGNGSFKLVIQNVAGSLNAKHVRDKMQTYVKEDGRITNLCVDFEGEYIPLANQCDIDIVSRLLARFHNQHINVNDQVR